MVVTRARSAWIQGRVAAMRRPDFFIVGAPKCGTTSLYAYLRQHPDIYLPAVKEPHYFYRGSAQFCAVNDLDRYLALFAGARPKQICGEASSCYILYPDSLTDILDFSPTAKIIAMIRNPVDMILSYHDHKVYSFQEDMADFATAWSISRERAAGRCVPPNCTAPEQLNYRWVARLGSKLKSIVALVPEAQRHTILFDDLVADPERVYGETLRFLGVRPWPIAEFARKNPRKTHRWPGAAQLAMYPPFPFDVVKKQLKRLLGPRGKDLGRQLYELAATPVKPHRPPAPLRRELARELAEEISLIESLVGRDLGHWRREDTV